jgi:hypothetical protein
MNQSEGGKLANIWAICAIKRFDLTTHAESGAKCPNIESVKSQEDDDE